VTAPSSSESVHIVHTFASCRLYSGGEIEDPARLSLHNVETFDSELLMQAKLPAALAPGRDYQALHLLGRKLEEDDRLLLRVFQILRHHGAQELVLGAHDEIDVPAR
jgi:hypothetical protein